MNLVQHPPVAESARIAPAAERAIQLAESLLRRAETFETPVERGRMKRVARLIADHPLRSVVMGMTDRFWRSKSASRTAATWRNLLSQFGAAEVGGQPSIDRLMLKLGGTASRYLSPLVIPLARRRLRQETAEVVLPAGEPAFSRYLRRRSSGSFRLNINQLGEAVLGEGEARRRLEGVLRLLARPDVNYASVKISAIYSQINVLAWDQTLAAIKERLRLLYRAAGKAGKFVNLDMEEYRDLGLTAAAFREVLDEPEFLPLAAGIVLQAYLPDSAARQRELTEWAKARRARGGAPIKVRLVKGANLAMEQVEAEWHGWRQAPFLTKGETDAAYKRMLEFACRPENAAAVRLGVASHNLFDVALAITLMRDAGVEGAVDFEMLEGMADAQARAVMEEVGSLLLYVPIVREADFGSALAYLVRRLDENTAPGNFLADLFSMKVGSPAWEAHKAAFLRAWESRDSVGDQPRRRAPAPRDPHGFSNEPDTDWVLAENRDRLAAALRPAAKAVALPEALDRDGVESALASAGRAQPGWESLGAERRAAILLACADAMAAQRFATIGVIRGEGKKAIPEADTEISEAIDFARYYAGHAAPPPGTEASALGVVVVAPPWNFPYAIPCGGVLAALAAGNAVILKPAPETRRIGFHLAEQLWAAGVPRDALQCVNCGDGETGKRLIADDRTAAVVLTGAWETALLFRSWRPDLRLFAETSGKNAIVVSALADRELAARDLVRSAFGHAGQKCSAASLGILEAEVYDDPVFRRQLCDAAASLACGPAEHPRSAVTPLIREPGEALRRALATLEPGESWLLEPRQDPGDPCGWSPGIKLGVRPGSWFHQTECFGPVLGLIRARDLGKAVRIQNDVPFGLTAGFHSLDESEIDAWRERVEAGNAYVNRGITGAIVRRQPFGGWKRSSVGPGAKAGGPNYVNLFRRLRDAAPRSVEAAAADYEVAWREHFAAEHDPSGLACESNVFRYRPRPGVVLRLPRRDESAALAAYAAKRCGTPLVLSIADGEPVAELIAKLPDLARRGYVLRTAGGDPEPPLLAAAAQLGMNWIDDPISRIGRVELTRWLREQAISETRHRYGNIKGGKAIPPR